MKKRPQSFEEALSRLETPDPGRAKQRNAAGRRPGCLSGRQRIGQILPNQIGGSRAETASLGCRRTGRVEPEPGRMNSKHGNKKPKAQTNCCWRISARLKPSSAHCTKPCVYVTLGGGKRLRPLLVLAASRWAKQTKNTVEQAMAAIEMLYVLFVGSRRYAGDGQRQSAPRQTDLPCAVRWKQPPFWSAMRCKPEPLMY